MIDFIKENMYKQKKQDDINFLNMLFSVVFIQSMEIIIQILVCHSNQVEDLDFEGINFPVSTNI